MPRDTIIAFLKELKNSMNFNVLFFLLVEKAAKVKVLEKKLKLVQI